MASSPLDNLHTRYLPSPRRDAYSRRVRGFNAVSSYHRDLRTREGSDRCDAGVEHVARE